MRPRGHAEWESARAELARTVAESLADLEVPLEIRGSFRFNDFHLDLATGRSYSDLDLVGSALEAVETDAIRQRIADTIEAACGSKLKVAIHPAEYFSGLNPGDARFLAIGEYLRLESARKASPGLADYHRAKTVLMALRSSPSERYRATAERLHSKSSRLALNVKLGLEPTFTWESAAELLDAVECTTEAAELLRLCGEESLSESDFFNFLEELRGRTEIPSWLRSLLLDRVSLEASRY